MGGEEAAQGAVPDDAPERESQLGMLAAIGSAPILKQGACSAANLRSLDRTALAANNPSCTPVAPCRLPRHGERAGG
jgi:hypothetical protein